MGARSSARQGGAARQRWDAAAIAAAALSGALIAATWLNFALYPLAWIAFAPLVWALGAVRDARQARRLGLIAGLVTNVPAFFWLVHTMTVFGGFPYPIALFFYACLSLFSAGQLVLFTAAFRRLGFGPLALAAPVLWVALEWVYPNLFPWRMGNTQLQAPLLMQIGDLCGPYGLSFVLVWLAAALARVVRTPARWTSLGASLLAAAALIAYGVQRQPVIESAMRAAPTLRVGLVQGNVGIREKGNVAYFDVNVDKYRELSRALQDDVDVILWPETVAQWWIPEETTRVTERENPFPDLRKFLIFGGLSYRYAAGEEDEPLRFNSAFLMGGDGRLHARYHKRILLPFGEYLPLASYFPFIKQFSPQTGEFTPGARLATLDLPGGARFAPLICYEDVPAGIARGMTQLGAQVLLTMFNDAWFGMSMAPYQHEAIAVWRAIENRRSFVRIGNAGTTGVVDPLGRVRQQLDLFAVGTVIAEIPLLDVDTFYTRHGDVFAGTVGAAALLWLAVPPLLATARRRRAGS